MYRKLMIPAFVLVFCLTSATNAIVIGDFENNSMDGWEAVDSSVTTGFFTAGATLNQSSIWIETQNGDNDALVLDVIEQGLVDEFRNNLKISMDITRLAAEWVEVDSSWCDLDVVINAGSNEEGGTWVFRGDAGDSSTWNPFLGDDPIHFVFDYSLTLPEIDFDNLEYLEIIIHTNWGGYDPGGVYYLDNIEIFGGGAAYAPNPEDGARAISSGADLSWTSGVYAETHDVYFGTTLNDVSNASRENTMDVLVSQNQQENTFDPGTLISGQTYYWRIDEVSGDQIWKGDIWSFTTAFPGAFVLGDWEGTLDGWYLWPDNPATYSFSTTGATLNQQSIKMSVDVTGRFIWILSIFLSPEELEILKANDLFSLDVTWDASEWIGDGNWCQVQWIAINAQDIGWNQIDGPASDTASPEEPGAWNPATFGDIHTRTIVWNYSEIPVANIPEAGWCQFSIATNHDVGFTNATYYFDNARLYNSRVASEPSPAFGEEEVPTQPTLSWDSGEGAVTHNVYFGDNYDDVNDATVDEPMGVLVSQNQEDTKYTVTTVLEYGQTYFWRVDEVASDGSITKGDVWRFVTGNYVIVDDFEVYSDYSPDEIWNTWIDGYDDPMNGSTAGYPDPDFVIGEHYVETVIVHSGRQSMPIFYDNTFGLSEVTRSFTSPLNNWTRENVDSLTLFYHGDAENAAEPLYVALNGSAVVANTDLNAALVTEWTRLDIPLQAFADQGVNLANVGSFSIGLGNKANPVAGGGSGHIFVDDVRLYRP